MKYKVVKDQYRGFNVMFKKHWYSRWKYCRSPKTKYSKFQHVWHWDTEKGVQTFINQQFKDERNVI